MPEENPEHIVGSIVTEKGAQPFVLHLKSGKLEVGTYAQPDAAQEGLSIIQQQRFAQLIHERTSVSFAQVRMGHYYCTHCGRWVEVTPEAWSISMCLSCSLDRGSELAERYATDASAPPASAPPPVPSATAPPPLPVLAAVSPGEPTTPALASQLERAIRLAADAHSGQVDKAGEPYILHPLRMMLTLRTPVEMMAAVLHDVVEDSAWTLEALRGEGFPEEVVEAVAGVTRQEDETYEAFIERAAQHPVARRVKLADLEDNMNLRRLATLTDADQARLARYLRAWRRLRGED